MSVDNKRRPKHRILVVDDEEDIHQITKISLKGLRYQGRRLEFLYATSGKQAVQVMKDEPNIGVILLDVVMESNTAGLDACRTIREELGNRFVRILLRTGQPGAAPEKNVIQEYDIDGYLPKAELTSVRLFTAVRTSLKAYCELMELERYRANLTSIHDCTINLMSYEPIEATLERILNTVVEICPSPLAAFHLETFDEEGNSQQYFLYRSSSEDPAQGQADAEHIRSHIAANMGSLSMDESQSLDDGFFVPLKMDHELGYGWIYVEESEPDEIVRQSLPMLAAHGANALYATVTQSIMSSREGELFDQMQI